MLHVTYLIILLPLVGFTVQLLVGRRLGDPVAGWVATFFIAASFLVSIGVYLDLTMVLFVTGVSMLIHLYSIGYMKGDRDFSKFFLYMNLFVASMLILVLGSN